MRNCRYESPKRIVSVRLRIREFLFEMPTTECHLSVAHEVPRQLAEHRFILEILSVSLSKGGVVWPDQQQAVGGACAGRVGRRAALRDGALIGSRVRDIPVSVARLFLVKRADRVIEQFAGAGV